MPEGWDVGGLGDKAEGTKKHRDRWSQNSRRDVKHSAGNTVSDVVVTVCGARWALEISGSL